MRLVLETLRFELPIEAHPNGAFDRDSAIIPELKAGYRCPSRRLDHDGPESQGTSHHA
jgi:hypothetical protein